MKISLAFFLIASFTSAQASQQRNKTINELYMTVNDLITVKEQFGEEFYHILKTSNRLCVKEKLNLNENGEKPVNGDHIQFLIFVAIELCVENRSEILTELFNEFSSFIGDRYKNQTDCFKSKLNQVEPMAAILQNFNSVIDNEECESASKEITRLLSMGFEDEEYCKTVALVQKFAFRLMIIKFGMLNEILKNSEIETVKQLLLQYMETSYNCLIKRI